MSKNNSPFKKVSINLPFHDFEKVPQFVGLFNEVTELGEKEEKKFEVGIFTDLSTGEQVFIVLSHSIQKAVELETTKPDETVFEIVFKGKTAKGDKQFNQFDIGVCTLKEYESFIKPVEEKTTKRNSSS